jgi:uncharacterized protein
VNRRPFALVVLSLAGLLPCGALAQGVQEVGPSSTPLVLVQGEAVLHLVPDLAFIGVAAESRARSPREAQLQNAEMMSAVQQKLLQAGVPKAAVRTTGYDLQPEWDYANGRQVLRGYVARNTIEIRVEDMARVGEIVDLAVASGATSVSGIRFDLKNRDAVERDALRQAVADARARADAAAAGAGRAVDRVLRIEEARNVQGPRPMMALSAARAEAAATPIAAVDVEVRAQVTLTAVLK